MSDWIQLANRNLLTESTNDLTQVDHFIIFTIFRLGQVTLDIEKRKPTTGADLREWFQTSRVTSTY